MAARVPYLNQEDLSDENKDLLKRPIWLTRALVNSPDTARAFHVPGRPYPLWHEAGHAPA